VRWRTIALAFWGLPILLSLPAQAASPRGGNCVAYARAVTGIELDGNAAAWWPHAAGRYERGQMPKLGAILVFKPSGSMHVGHVAVVSRIVDPREILVDQANWIPGRVVRAMSVIDASPANDWTSVKVIELHSGTHGRENATYGFIYPHNLPVGLAEANTDSTDPHHVQEHVGQSHDEGRRERTKIAAAGNDVSGLRQAHQHVADAHDKHHREHEHAHVAEAHDQDRHEHAQLGDAKTHRPKSGDANPKRLGKHDRPHKGQPEDAKLAYLH
jgi:hypothetical protein